MIWTWIDGSIAVTLSLMAVFGLWYELSDRRFWNRKRVAFAIFFALVCTRAAWRVWP